jgi:pilus assembly protein CpaF
MKSLILLLHGGYTNYKASFLIAFIIILFAEIHSMLLKHRILSLPQTKEEAKVEFEEEDAWLNDMGSSSQSQPPLESKPEAAEPSHEKEHPVTEEVPSISQSHKYIGPGHPLWPVVLRLRERIWQELYQKPGILSTSRAFLVNFVQKRAIDLLHEEPKLAQKVGDIAEAKLVLHSLVNEVLDYGPLETLMKDESVSEIMVVGPHFACIERNGAIEDVPCNFEDDRHMERIIENMLRRAGRHMKPDWPIVDMRLPDGSLVNVVMPPSAVNGPTITIRKASKKPLSIDDLIQMETLTSEMAEFLRACIQAHLNIVICGGIASGRTTLLNALSAYIPAEERITTIEEVAELRLSQKHVVALVSQVGSPASTGTVTVHDLVVNALRIGSERILLGECRGDEIVGMLQAMNNGYNGFLMTLYANDLRNCLTRLETMYLAAATTLPVTLIRAQIASALDVIVHVSRLRDGSRKILNIAEVQYMENDAIKLQSIFHFKDAGFDATSRELKGAFEPSGFSPSSLPNFEAMGIHLPPEMFQSKCVQT